MIFGARLGAHPWPRPVVGGPARGPDRAINVVDPGLGHPGDLVPIGRSYIGKVGAARRVSAVDEESGFNGVVGGHIGSARGAGSL